MLALVLALTAQSQPWPLAWDEFPVFVWRETYAGKPLPANLREPFGGVILMRDEDSGWARDQELDYLVWNVAGRNALHLDADEAWKARVERWIETRDEALLVRTPCLEDPRTQAEMQATLDRTIAKHGVHPGLAFVLGDEVSLTPNGAPFDLCRCSFCAQLWKEHARSLGLPERAPLTDEVLTALRAGKVDGLGAWLEHRRFQQERLLTWLEALAMKVRQGTLGGEPALLGMIGQTPFGGIAAERVRFPVVEHYPLPGLRELGEQPRGLEQKDPAWLRSIATLFLEGESPAGASWLAFEHWLQGADALVLWSDRALEQDTERRGRLASSVQTIRELQSKGLRWSPTSRYGSNGRNGKVALLVDADSNALAFLHDALEDGKTWPRRFPSYQQEHGSNERRLQAWLAALERLQIEPVITTLDHCRSELTSGAPLKLAVLAGRRVIDPGDIALLERATERGLLVVDGPFAEVDRRGRRLPPDTLAGLCARMEARIAVCDSLDDTDLPKLPDWLARVGLQAPPTARFTGAAAERAWLEFHATRSFGVGGWRIAALPATHDAAERSRLADITLTAEAPQGWELRWIHPSGDGQRVLRAGDAAVYDLVEPAAERERERRAPDENAPR